MLDVTDRVKLAQSQVQSAIEERQRLARDLHDTVAQTLYNLTFLSEAVRRMAKAGEKEQEWRVILGLAIPLIFVVILAMLVYLLTQWEVDGYDIFFPRWITPW